MNAIDSDACPTIGFIRDQQPIILPGAHITTCFKLLFRHKYPAGNVTDGVSGNSVWKQ
eukprot:COSAG06_NODE_33320_length_491_cov_4.933673_2_plen_57_part_01